MQTQQQINFSELFTANKVLFISSAAFLSVFVLGSIGFFIAKVMKQRKVYSKLLDLELGPQETKCAKLITKTGIANEIKQTEIMKENKNTVAIIEPKVEIPKVEVGPWNTSTFGQYFASDVPWNNLNRKYTEADLVSACKFGDFGIVLKCIEQGVSVNAVDQGFSALYSAVLGKNERIVQYLLESDADVNYTGSSRDDSVYILLNAVVNGNVGIVELLLEYGASVNLDKLLDKIGIPLNLEIAKLLVRHGAKIMPKHIKTLRPICNNKGVNEKTRSEAQKVYDYLISVNKIDLDAIKNQLAACVTVSELAGIMWGLWGEEIPLNEHGITVLMGSYNIYYDKSFIAANPSIKNVKDLEMFLMNKHQLKNSPKYKCKLTIN